MRVVAIEMCFVQGSRVRPGTEFEFDTTKCKKDAAGNIVLPKALAPSGTKVQDKVAHDLAAVTAAAGPKRKGVTAVKVLHPEGLASSDDLL